MPAFTLYGARGSTNTDRVRITLAEGGFDDYDVVLYNLHKGEQKVSAALFILTRRDVIFPTSSLAFCPRHTNTVMTSLENI